MDTCDQSLLSVSSENSGLILSYGGEGSNLCEAITSYSGASWRCCHVELSGLALATMDSQLSSQMMMAISTLKARNRRSVTRERVVPRRTVSLQGHRKPALACSCRGFATDSCVGMHVQVYPAWSRYHDHVFMVMARSWGISRRRWRTRSLDWRI